MGGEDYPGISDNVGHQDPRHNQPLSPEVQSVKALVKSLQSLVIIIIKVVSEGKLRASSRKNFTKI